MKTSEQFALNEWLSDYPEDATFDDVLDMVRNDDERIDVWQVVESLPRYQVAECIDNTRQHFECVTEGETA